MRQVVCVVDDDRSSREALAEILERQGCEVLTAADGKAFLGLLEKHDIDLVITDLIMPGVGGLDILKHCLDKDPDIQVIMVTGYGSVETAVRAMQDGAYHYLTKPVKPAELKELVRRALTVRRLKLENQVLKRRIADKFSFDSVIGTGPAMERVFELVRLVAPTKSTVLLEGESGTGKEVIANLIHENSSRASGPYIKINCAAIVESLLESELFGHIAGAFTGALRDKVGRFQSADGGTLLLDEIAEMSLTTQTKLLRVLQEGEIERVGDVAPLRVDVRIIAATNRCLHDEVVNGNFREDLYYRLKVVSIKLPPLRERSQDIPLLVSRFIEEFNELHGRRVEGISAPAMEILRCYHWPGNIRELRNVIEGAVVTTVQGRLDVDTLPPEIRRAPMDTSRLHIPVGMTIDEVEQEMIRRALENTDGNRTRAAKLLGMSLRTLQRKLKTMEGRKAVDG